MLFHMYRDLWCNFFVDMGVEIVLSPETNKQIVNLGNLNCIDEACFSSKIFVGHVAWLMDKCDMIFVPRFENTAIKEDYCTRIIGLYDLVRNTFPNAKLLHADVNYLFRKREQEAFVQIGEKLGKTREEAIAAYTKARAKHDAEKVAKFEKQKLLANEDGLKVLIISHSYNTCDAVIGKGIVKFLNDAKVKVLYADVVEPAVVKDTNRELFGNRLYWKVNSELVGGAEYWKNYVDGIILISTFPCGPDSIFNEMIIRNIKGKPVLNIMVDELDASAGLITRLESFTDILEARKETRK